MKRLATAAAATALLTLTACGGGGGGDGAAGGTGAAPAPADAVTAEFSQAAADLLPQAIKDSGTMTWTGAPKPPFYVDGADGFTGLGPDLEAAMEQVLDIDIEFQPTDGLNSVLLSLQSARADFFIGGVRATPERQKDFDLVGWLTIGPSYLISSDRADELKAPGDLCGNTVAYEEGSSMESFVTKLAEECSAGGGETLTPLPLTADGARLAVDSGRADAFAANESDGRYIQLQREGRYEVIVQDTGSSDLTAGMALRGSGVGEAVTAAFQALIDQGVYEELMTKWNLADSMVDEPVLNPA
ncbi:transporter substrate-binding domain-containing protein [Modestobacter sp. VKM Ac-2986]|uniref:transporter substrate-binding domain-containing protein n=1 Tax=Modestobacter sp. VKM Ac-2986 TaxID=3004140 RepID=UPI0022AB1FB2|nr:transporter substrate-binding domain-containing protein [Modestobacter sp. VKM Ac-2986]MCZ2828849.1 transporter substrate-binding domain-containing protein [Modestobacter sp. VKM Ac-2986]